MANDSPIVPVTGDEAVPPEVRPDEDRVELREQIDQLREAYRRADGGEVDLLARMRDG